VFINASRRSAKPWDPNFDPKFCYRCRRYGHLAADNSRAKCKKEERCGRCGGDHATQPCKSEIKSCLRCTDAGRTGDIHHEDWKCKRGLAEDIRVECEKRAAEGPWWWKAYLSIVSLPPNYRAGGTDVPIDFSSLNASTANRVCHCSRSSTADQRNQAFHDTSDFDDGFIAALERPSRSSSQEPTYDLVSPSPVLRTPNEPSVTLAADARAGTDTVAGDSQSPIEVDDDAMEIEGTDGVVDRGPSLEATALESGNEQSPADHNRTPAETLRIQPSDKPADSSRFMNSGLSLHKQSSSSTSGSVAKKTKASQAKKKATEKKATNKKATKKNKATTTSNTPAEQPVVSLSWPSFAPASEDDSTPNTTSDNAAVADGPSFPISNFINEELPANVTFSKGNGPIRHPEADSATASEVVDSSDGAATHQDPQSSYDVTPRLANRNEVEQRHFRPGVVVPRPRATSIAPQLGDEGIVIRDPALGRRQAYRVVAEDGSRHLYLNSAFSDDWSDAPSSDADCHSIWGYSTEELEAIRSRGVLVDYSGIMSDR